MSFEDDHEVREIPTSSRMQRQSAELVYRRIRAHGEERDKRELLNLLKVPEHSRASITAVNLVDDGLYVIYRE